MKKSPPIKAVLFDFGGTIDSDGIPWKEHFYPLYKKHGIDWPQEKFDRCFYDSDDWITEKSLRNKSFIETLRMQVGLVLKNGGAYSSSLTEKIAQAFYKSCLKSIKRNKPLLKKLSKKYKLGIISNFYGNLPYLCKEFGIAPYFTAIIDSNRVGFIKPHPRIFQTALEKVRATPETSVFVGDSQKRDMFGAKSMGMRHIWLVEKSHKNAKPCCPKDPIIHSFLDLEKIL